MTEIAGLPVKTEPPGLVHPLRAVAVIEGLDDNDQLRQWLVSAGDITAVTAIGMHRAATVMYEKALPASGV